MKHGRTRRTPGPPPEWYRRWEASQTDEPCYVLGGTILVISPRVRDRLHRQFKDSPAAPVLFGMGGLEIRVDPAIAPRWVNRAMRKSRKWKRMRKQVRAALKDDSFLRQLHHAAAIFSPRRPYVPLS